VKVVPFLRGFPDLDSAAHALMCVHLPVPDLPGLLQHSTTTATTATSDGGGGGGLKKRFVKLVRGRASADVHRYSHWLRYCSRDDADEGGSSSSSSGGGGQGDSSHTARASSPLPLSSGHAHSGGSSGCCGSAIVSVVSHGVPRRVGGGGGSSSSALGEEGAMLQRRVLIRSPLSLTNLLACDILVRLCRLSLPTSARGVSSSASASASAGGGASPALGAPPVPAPLEVHARLRPGQQWDTLAFDPTDLVEVCIRPMSGTSGGVYTGTAGVYGAVASDAAAAATSTDGESSDGDDDGSGSGSGSGSGPGAGLDWGPGIILQAISDGCISGVGTDTPLPSLDAAAGTGADADPAPETLSCDVLFDNGATLAVQAELTASSGTRAVLFYVPYWLVTSTAMGLFYQHDCSHGASSSIAGGGSSSSVSGGGGQGRRKAAALNGSDDLAADQASPGMSALAVAKAAVAGAHGVAHTALPRGVGFARGIGGVLLGPDVPVRGLADVLTADGPSVARGRSCQTPFSRLLRRPAMQEDFSSLLLGLPDALLADVRDVGGAGGALNGNGRGGDDGHNDDTHTGTGTGTGSHGGHNGHSGHSAHPPSQSYKLSLLGYTREPSKKLHLRLRGKSTGMFYHHHIFYYSTRHSPSLYVTTCHVVTLTDPPRPFNLPRPTYTRTHRMECELQSRRGRADAPQCGPEQPQRARRPHRQKQTPAVAARQAHPARREPSIYVWRHYSCCCAAFSSHQGSGGGRSSGGGELYVADD